MKSLGGVHLSWRCRNYKNGAKMASSTQNGRLPVVLSAWVLETFVRVGIFSEPTNFSCLEVAPTQGDPFVKFIKPLRPAHLGHP